jgi:hypothetical protein
MPLITDWNIHNLWKLVNHNFQEEVLSIPFPLILYYVLTNLQFVLKFVCPFIIREGALRGDEVENLIVVIIVINVTPNQLSIPYQAFHIRSALN